MGDYNLPGTLGCYLGVRVCTVAPGTGRQSEGYALPSLLPDHEPRVARSCGEIQQCVHGRGRGWGALCRPNPACHALLKS